MLFLPECQQTILLLALCSQPPAAKSDALLDLPHTRYVVKYKEVAKDWSKHQKGGEATNTEEVFVPLCDLTRGSNAKGIFRTECLSAHFLIREAKKSGKSESGFCTYPWFIIFIVTLSRLPVVVCRKPACASWHQERTRGGVCVLALVSGRAHPLWCH